MLQSKSKLIGSLQQAERTSGSSVHSRTKDAWSALCADFQVSKIESAFELAPQWETLIGPLFSSQSPTCIELTEY